jgi:cobalamin synthase
LAAGYWAVPAALLAGLAVLRLRSSARRRLGGVTGDVLGTCEQAVEILILTMGVIVVDIDTPLWTGFL